MAVFYKGVAPGTFLSRTDLRTTGLMSRLPGAAASNHALLTHICDGTSGTPYTSLTRSYGIAKAYAFAGRVPPSAAMPGHVYEIIIDKALPSLEVLDPIRAIASLHPDPLSLNS